VSLITLYGSLEGLGTEVQIKVPPLDINYGEKSMHEKITEK